MPTYASFCYVKDLPEVGIVAANVAQRWRDEGSTVAADRLARAATNLKRELEVFGRATSIKATEILLAYERSSRVRPDSVGGGGPRLEDFLRADPLVAIAAGTVGVGNEELLDSGVPWWITNEIGSSARMHSRTMLFGSFQPGEAAPSQGESRVHPLFRPENSDSGEGGWMTIKRPIPARRFIERSLPEIFVLWHAGFDIINTAFLAEVDVAIAEATAKRDLSRDVEEE